MYPGRHKGRVNMRSVTLRLHETMTLNSELTITALRALTKVGYTDEDSAQLDPRTVRLARNVTVPVEVEKDLEGALRHEFSSGLIKTLGRFGLEPVLSEGIDVTNYTDDSVDLEKWVTEPPAVGSWVTVTPKASNDFDTFSGIVSKHNSDGTVQVQVLGPVGERIDLDPDQIEVDEDFPVDQFAD